MDFLLSLPGAQGMFDGAFSALEAGMPVVQFPCPDQGKVESELLHRLSDRGWRQIFAGRDGLADIATALGLDRPPTPEQVPMLAQFARSVLVVDCRLPEVADWAVRAARLMSQKPRPKTLGLWLISPPPTGVDARQFRLQLDRHVTLQEVRAFASYLFVDRPGPGPTHYLEAVCREVAGADYRLVERLSRLPSADLFNMSEALAGCADHVAPADLSISKWVCSVKLAVKAKAGDAAAAAALGKRIWRAQIQEFLPAMEVARPAYLAQFSQQLQQRVPVGPDTEVQRIPDDVEWSAAWFHLRGAIPDAHHVLIGRLRYCRNELAHARALSAANIAMLCAAASTAFRQVWSTQ